MSPEVLVQLCGWLGSAVILLTYLALSFGWINGKGWLYQLSIISSSMLYGYMNWKLGAIPAIPINVIFGLLAITILVRSFAVRSNHTVRGRRD